MILSSLARGAITLTILFAPWLWLMPFCATWATPKPCARGVAATPTRGANTTVIFFDWVNRPDPYPYNSFGNDSAMRVSPIAWFYDNEDEVRLQAEASAAVTHNHPEGIKGAVAIAVAILRIRQAPVKDPYIFEDVADEFYYDEYTCSEAFDRLPERGYFDATCQGCVPLSLYIAATATSFEDAIRQAVSYGGDSDAVGAIVGSLAEARFHVPPEMLATAMSLLPAEMRRIVDAFDAHLGR